MDEQQDAENSKVYDIHNLFLKLTTSKRDTGTQCPFPTHPPPLDLPVGYVVGAVGRRLGSSG